MKKAILLACITLPIIFSCTKASDALDTLDSVGCLNTLVRLSNNDDDLTCAELSAELNKIEKSCKDFLDEETRAEIALIKALCEDD